MEELQNLVNKLKFTSNNEKDKNLFLTDTKDIKHENLEVLINDLTSHLNISNTKSNQGQNKAVNQLNANLLKNKKVVIDHGKEKFSKPQYNTNGVLNGFRNQIVLDRKMVKNEVKSAVSLMHRLEELEKAFFYRKVNLKDLIKKGMREEKAAKEAEKKRSLVKNLSQPNLAKDVPGSSVPKLARTRSDAFINNIKSEKVERIKTFKVYPIQNWFERNGFLPPNMSNAVMNNLEIQSGMIIDELDVFVENIHFFKTTYLGGDEVLKLFEILSPMKQASYNKIMEETCGLMMEVAKLILVEFFQYMEKFVSVQQPSEEKLRDCRVKNEKNSFCHNVRLLGEIMVFFKSCFEVYKILVRQVDDMIIPQANFLKLTQFIARARYNVSSLIFTMKNHLVNYTNDMKNTNKYMLEAYKEPEEDDTTDKEAKSTKKKIKLKKLKADEDYVRRVQPKINEETLKLKRLNIILRQEKDENDSFEKKKKSASSQFKKEFGIGSELISRLMKYCPKETKNKIISQRIVERYREKSEDEE